MTEPKSSGRLSGKVAIVTGGGSGFGAAICKRFVEEGCLVVVSDINDENGQKIASISPNNMTYISSDVTSQTAWNQLIKATLEKYARLDILVNNAGTSYKNKPTLEVTEDEFDKTFLVNVKSIFWSVKETVPHLKRGASIINISSVAASRPRGGLVWYSASKGTVSTATQGLAAEYAPLGIRVNSICPLLSGTGLFEMFAGVPYTEENVAKFLGNVPLGRLTDPLDVANMALFLASDESSFVTGTNNLVDGGRAI